MTIAIMDLNGNLVKQFRHIISDHSPEKLLKYCCLQIESMLKATSIPRNKVLGIGFATDGAVNSEMGKLLFSVKLGWRDVPIKEIVETESGLRCLVDGTTSSIAFGEYLYGAGKKSDCMLVVDVSSGIGALVVSENQILRGFHSVAGEIGHSLALPDGPVCQCGKKGCLEAIASGPAMISEIKQAIEAGKKTELKMEDLLQSEPCAIRVISQAVRNGDVLAREIFKRVSYYLGIEIAHLVNFVDPQIVVLSGYVFEETDGLLLDGIRKVAEENILDYSHRVVRIEEGILGDRAVMLGIGASLGESVFSVSIA